MPTNYTPLTNGQFATAAVFNAPLEELDDALEAVVAGSKALTAPDITSFANSTHTHQDAANGGSLDAAAIGTGTLNNARVNWAAPSAIGGTTPAAITGTTLTATSAMALTLAAGNSRLLNYQSGGVNRWAVYADNAAESGSEAGSDFRIGRYFDNGTFRDDAMVITRSSRAVYFPGTVSKGGGTFLIDHPLDPANRNLLHSFVEGPRADLIYRGHVQLSNGQAVVDIDTASGMTPGTFAALTKHTDAQVFLQNEGPGWSAVRGALVGGTLTIEAERNNSNDRVAWLVIAERNDAFYLASDLTDAQGRFVVEVDKEAPTAQELALLDPIESDDLADTLQETIAVLIGKRGYPMHGHLTGLTVPMREIRPRKPRGG